MTNKDPTSEGPGVESARQGAEEVAPDSPVRVTELLQAWSTGDDRALERLVPLVEAELRRLARGYMRRERREHTLQVTALVNEAFLRLIDARQLRWQWPWHVTESCFWIPNQRQPE